MGRAGQTLGQTRPVDPPPATNTVIFGNTRMGHATFPGHSSSPPLALLLFWLPAMAIAASEQAKIGVGGRTLTWTAALTTMGFSCMTNAARYGRVHCFLASGQVPLTNGRNALQRIERFRPLLEPILRRGRVPTELAAVVFVESSGVPAALSPKGARGLWQLMPDAARCYVRVVHGERDDRLDMLRGYNGSSGISATPLFAISGLAAHNSSPIRCSHFLHLHRPLHRGLRVGIHTSHGLLLSPPAERILHLLIQPDMPTTQERAPTPTVRSR